MALSDDHLLPPPFDDFDLPPLVFPPLPLFEDGGGLCVLDLALLLVKMGLVGPLVVGTGMSEDAGGIVGTVTMGDAEGVSVGSFVRGEMVGEPGGSAAQNAGHAPPRSGS